MPRVVAAFGRALALAISCGVQHDGYGDQGDSAEEEQGVARRVEQVAGNRADDQRQADADREGDGEAGYIDGGDKKKVGDVEDHSAGNGEEDSV